MGVWHTYSTRQTLSELETDKSRGLSGAEAVSYTHLTLPTTERV